MCDMVNISCEIGHMWIAQDVTDDDSTLVHQFSTGNEGNKPLSKLILTKFPDGVTGGQWATNDRLSSVPKYWTISYACFFYRWWHFVSLV